MPKQAAIYARVSTDEQAEKGYSLPAQVEACRKFAEQQGFDVAAVFQDDISGAKPITSRPDGARLQRSFETGQAMAVIIHRVDRLSRDIVDLLTTVRDWLRAGVDIYALDVGQVTSELDIVLVIKGWQGSDERKKIIERTSTGRWGKAKDGKVVGCGLPPYGYSYDDGQLMIDESQAPIVRMIFDWYVNGDENRRMMSLQKIGLRLTRAGIPTPAHAKEWIGKLSNREAWEAVTVQRIIISETYCGTWHYGKNIGAHNRGGKRPKSEQIAVSVPAIVSLEMWEQAQARRAYNSKIARRRMKREYLLRGLVFCGCGHHMVIGKNHYYCTMRNHTNSAGKCHESSVDGRLIEPLTWDYVMALVTDPVSFEEKLREAQSQELHSVKPRQTELEHIDALIKQTEREADEIARAMTKTKGLVAAKLEQQSEEVNRRYQALTARREELQEALKLELTDNVIDDLMQFREIVAAGLSNPTFEDKRRWLELLQVRVTVTGGKAVISCRLRGSEGPIDAAWPIEKQTSISLIGFGSHR